MRSADDLFGGQSLRRLPLDHQGAIAVDTDSQDARLRDQCLKLIRRHDRRSRRHLLATLTTRTTTEELRQLRTLLKRSLRK